MKGFQVGDPRAREAGRKGGAVRAAARRAEAERAIRARWPDIPSAAVAWILAERWRAYQAGWRAKRRAS